MPTYFDQLLPHFRLKAEYEVGVTISSLQMKNERPS